MKSLQTQRGANDQLLGSLAVGHDQMIQLN